MIRNLFLAILALGVITPFSQARAPVVAVRAPVVAVRAPVVFRQRFIAPIFIAPQQFVAPIPVQQFVQPVQQFVQPVQQFVQPQSTCGFVVRQRFIITP